jgi:hypothetical protein
MAALRDLTRNLSGGERPGGRGPKQPGVDEVCEALAKRLKAFPPTPEASADEPASEEGDDHGEGPSTTGSAGGPPPPDKLGEE